jgi:predicted enzyme related to lactoylglutathione lyase
MKRFHVHVSVDNLSESIRFYSTLFATAPTVEKPDYAKWMLDDPRINFAISKRGTKPGVDHIGIQTENEEELLDLHNRMHDAGIEMLTQTGQACCYAESNKHWAVDPSGIAWETYHTLKDIPTFDCGPSNDDNVNAACCTPNKKENTNGQKCCNQ